MEYSVLLAEDDAQLRTILTFFLQKMQFKVFPAENGHEALNIFESEQIDLVYSDVMMPLVNGWDLVKTIRRTSNVPIIMVTALSSVDDQLKGLELGVNDYLVKPVHPDILIAKINNCIRFYNASVKTDDSAQKSESFVYEKLAVNPVARTVKIDKTNLSLSKTEFDLLWLFLHNNNVVLSREHIINSIWPYQSYVENRVVDTFVKALRKKLGVYGEKINTVYGIGYKWTIENE